MPRKKHPVAGTDGNVFLYVLNPKFEGKGLPWMRRSLCRRYPAHWWDTYEYNPGRPVEDRIRIAREQDKARKICAVCPVRKECDSFALETLQPANIWAGRNPIQRRRHLREKTNV